LSLKEGALLPCRVDKRHDCMLFSRSFELPHALAGHTISVSDFNQRYVSPVLAHSGVNVVLFIQDKVRYCSHTSGTVILVYVSLLSYLSV